MPQWIRKTQSKTNGELNPGDVRQSLEIGFDIAEITSLRCISRYHVNLKDKCSTLRLLLSTQFKMLASFQRQLSSIFAFITFQTQHNLLRRFSLYRINNPFSKLLEYLLVEHRFRLTTITALFSVVSSFSLFRQYSLYKWGGYLSEDTRFTGFVLSDLVDGVFSAVFALAVGTASLWNVDYIISL